MGDKPATASLKVFRWITLPFVLSLAIASGLFAGVIVGVVQCLRVILESAFNGWNWVARPMDWTVFETGVDGGWISSRIYR